MTTKPSKFETSQCIQRRKKTSFNLAQFTVKAESKNSITEQGVPQKIPNSTNLRKTENQQEKPDL